MIFFFLSRMISKVFKTGFCREKREKQKQLVESEKGEEKIIGGAGEI